MRTVAVQGIDPIKNRQGIDPIKNIDRGILTPKERELPTLLDGSENGFHSMVLNLGRQGLWREEAAIAALSGFQTRQN